MTLGDRVRVKSEPELGVVVIRALFLMPDDSLGADVVPAGWKSPHARSFPIAELEAVDE